MSQLGSITGDIGDDIAALRADLGRLSSLVDDLARAQAETVLGRMRGQTIGSQPHRDDDVGAELGASLLRQTGLKATVIRDPLPSLLLALAGGFALGMMNRR